MKIKLSFRRVTCTFVLFFIGFGSACVRGWEPEKPVEVVVDGIRGSGIDKTARKIITNIETQNLSSKRFIPINRGGSVSSKSTALTYLNNNSGDDYIIMITSNRGIDMRVYLLIANVNEEVFIVGTPGISTKALAYYREFFD